MGTISASELDTWLSAGGLVVTSSDRAARAILRAYSRARQRENRTAWIAPTVMHWQAFVRDAWEKSASDARLVLSPQQELLLWRRIVGSSSQPASFLEEPRRKLAALAMQAHALLCSYAPHYLELKRRAGWDQDAAIWSEWLEQFEASCTRHATVSAERLALELPAMLDRGKERPRLVLAGFDRLTLSQRALLDAWGDWRLLAPSNRSEKLAFHRAPDSHAELAACAAWCRQILQADPNGRVLVIAQDGSQRRGEMERAFLRENERGADLRFEFSLGIPLGQAQVVRSAGILLRWLDGAIEEHELDWLIASGHTAVDERETAELAAAMRAIRRRKQQRPQWSLQTFAQESAPLARAWVARMASAQDQLAAAAGRERSPLEWAELATGLLDAAGWAGARPQSSADFQAARRWTHVLEECGSLGFDGQRMRWSEFFTELRATLNETLFAPESEDAPIVIAGPAESAGLQADAIWFLGADESAWPACGSMNPLLPPRVQRDAGMPHATPALDWQLAQSVTERLLRSASEVRFSFAAQAEGTDARPCRLVKQLAGAPAEMPHEYCEPSNPGPIALAHEDTSRVPLALAAEGDAPGPPPVHGGSDVITAQSNCPFKAFATARLRAETWDDAEASLTPPERGNLVHAVLHSIWAGPPHGLRTLADLRAVADLRSLVAEHVRGAMAAIPRRVREQMPERYLALEETRLVRLIATWLEYERKRADFTVADTELEKSVVVSDLLLKLRLDRLDRLNDGTFLVIDYKTGLVTDRAWFGDRPEDLQLPLYASCGRNEEQTLSGLVFASVQAGKNMGFAGRVGNARATLLPDLGPACVLVKKPFEAEQLADWRDKIERLARDFLAGRADVDPRDPPKTCERCGLHVLCRIQEREPAVGDEDAAEEDVDA